MGAIALVGFPTAAAGETFWPNPPIVNEVEVACNIVDGQRYTVRVQTKRDGLNFSSLRFDFKNVQGGTGALVGLTPQPSPVSATATVFGYLPYYQLQNQVFDIPPGVYDLTVTRSDQTQRGELILRNVTVPATVGTGGRGTGCKFL